LLNLIFSPKEVLHISSIPPSCTNRKDTLIWRVSKNGRFTVRSAYFLQKNLMKRGMVESSRTRGHATIWKKVWTLPIPNTERKDLWRALNDILPTKDNLRKKKNLQDPSCPIYGLEPETILHILWQCQSSRDVWSLGNRSVQKSSTYGESFREVLEDLFQKCSPSDMVQVAGLIRRIWLRRNEVVFGGIMSSPQSLLQRTDQAIAKFNLAQEIRTITREAMTRPGFSQWTAPSQAWIKVNWDAALS
jgi:hypothetical protein